MELTTRPPLEVTAGVSFSLAIVAAVAIVTQSCIPMPGKRVHAVVPTDGRVSLLSLEYPLSS